MSPTQKFVYSTVEDSTSAEPAAIQQDTVAQEQFRVAPPRKLRCSIRGTQGLLESRGRRCTLASHQFLGLDVLEQHQAGRAETPSANRHRTRSLPSRPKSLLPSRPHASSQRAGSQQLVASSSGRAGNRPIAQDLQELRQHEGYEGGQESNVKSAAHSGFPLLFCDTVGMKAEMLFTSPPSRW
jgi:hypothetical protein